MNQFLRPFAAVTIVCFSAALAQYRSDVRLVVIHATITDKHGTFVTDLPLDAFHVFENGRPQVLKQVVQEDIPVTLGLLVDDSGSMRRLRPLVMEAVQKMVDVLNPDDEVFMAHFSMYFSIDVPLTTGQADLHSALTGLAWQDRSVQWQTGTNFFDCLQQSLSYIEKTAHRDRTAVLVITDGSDTTSLLTLKQLIVDIGHRESMIYAVGLPSRNNKRWKAALQEITETSGGQAFFPSDASELPGITLQIAQEMRSQYPLTYRPENQDLDGAFREIAITVNSPPRFAGLVRRGLPREGARDIRRAVQRSDRREEVPC
jgi:Ca-activated chloride channel family protein